MTKIYRLTSITGTAPLVVDFVQSGDEIFEYFIMGNRNAKIPSTLTAELQCSEDKARVAKRDVIDASIGVLIVSENFLELMDKEFYQEVHPIKLLLCYEGETAKTGYILDITRTLNLVDKAKSSFFDDQQQYVRRAVCKNAVEEPFFIARDRDYSAVFRISETLAKTIEHLVLEVCPEA